MDNTTKLGVWLIGLVVVVALGMMLLPFTIVGETQRGLVLRNGALDRTLMPGFHGRIPLIEDVVKADLTVQTYEASIPVYSSDGQTVTTKVSLTYKVDPTQVESAYRDTQFDYRGKIMVPNIPDILESSLSTYSANELIQNRSTLGSKVKSVVIERFIDRPYLIVQAVSVEMDFDDAYESAINNKQVQEQQALAQVNITKQEDEKKKQEILKAEALSEKTRLEAQALASQEGNKVIEKIYAEASLELAKKWNGSVPATYIAGANGEGGASFLSFLNLNDIVSKSQ